MSSIAYLLVYKLFLTPNSPVIPLLSFPPHPSPPLPTPLHCPIPSQVYVIDLGEKGESYPCSVAEATVEIDIMNLNDNPPYWIGCEIAQWKHTYVYVCNVIV